MLHDDNLERTSNGWGVAGELNWQDLLRVDAGGWFSGEFKGEPLPLLSQVAARCRQHGMMANIEIKPTTGTGTLTGKVVALAARELWAGMTPPLLSSLKLTRLKRRSRRFQNCRAVYCLMNGVTTGANSLPGSAASRFILIISCWMKRAWMRCATRGYVFWFIPSTDPSARQSCCAGEWTASVPMLLIR